MKKQPSPHSIPDATRTVEESKTEADSAPTTSRPMTSVAQIREFKKDFEIAEAAIEVAKDYLRAETAHVENGGIMRRTWPAAVKCGEALRRMHKSGNYLENYDDWTALCQTLKVDTSTSDRLMECADKLRKVPASSIGTVPTPISGKGTIPEPDPEQEDVDVEIYEAEMPGAPRRPRQSTGEGAAPMPQARPRPKFDKAEVLLRKLLGGGRKVRDTAIIGKARGVGISERTLHQTKERLGVRSERVGFGRGSYVVWTLPVENP
jgi:hypothetical protein